MSEIRNEIGDRIRTRRLELRLSEGALAHFCDVTVDKLRRYERGTSPLDVSMVSRLAETLNVPKHYFLEDSPKSQTLNVAAEFLESDDGRRLLELFVNMPPTMRRQLLDFLEAMRQWQP